MAQRTVWLVEDHKVLAESIKRNLLKSFGEEKCNIDIFPTADEAIDAIHRIGDKSIQKPDLIITDNRTNSAKSGLDVLDAAKEAGIKAIMHSFSAEIEREAIKRGAIEFVLKGSGDLISVVNTVFNQQPDIQGNKQLIHR